MRLLVERGAPAHGLAADVEPLAKPGRPTKDTPKGDNITVSERGTSAAYLVRKLKRDAPEIAEALARGEYRSARAAAKAAGLVRDKTPLEQLEYWWARAGKKERKAFWDRIGAGGV